MLASFDQRLILFHKQDTSARLRFLIFADGLLAFAPPPRAAQLRAQNEARAVVRPHPAYTLRHAERQLDVAQGTLRIEADFYAELEYADGIIPVSLVEFTGIDPPFDLATRLGGRFVSLSDARGLPPVELELAGRAYRTVLGWK